MISVNKPPRYYVDEWVGSIAVLDNTKVNEDENGLSADSDGVVKFWIGIQILNSNSSFVEWIVEDKHKTEAYELCALLNSKTVDNDKMPCYNGHVNSRGYLTWKDMHY